MMKNWMLTLGVLLLVSYSNALANKHREKKLIISLDQPDTVYVRYRQPINGYSISGNAIASTDTVFQNCYNLTLTFRNIKTDREFSVNAGLLPRDYFVEYESNATDTIVLDYTEYTESDTVDIPDAPFSFADLDFDGQKELLTDYRPWIGIRHSGIYQSIYKIEQDSLKEIRLDLISPAYQESIIGYLPTCCFCGINYSSKEIYTYIWGGGNRAYNIYKLVNTYCYILTNEQPLLVIEYALSRRVEKVRATMHVEYYDEHQLENYKCNNEFFLDFGRLD